MRGVGARGRWEGVLSSARDAALGSVSRIWLHSNRKAAECLREAKVCWWWWWVPGIWRQSEMGAHLSRGIGTNLSSLGVKKTGGSIEDSDFNS